MLMALGLFALGSALCGSAQSMSWLIAARSKHLNALSHFSKIDDRCSGTRSGRWCHSVCCQYHRFRPGTIARAWYLQLVDWPVRSLLHYPTYTTNMVVKHMGFCSCYWSSCRWRTRRRRPVEVVLLYVPSVLHRHLYLNCPQFIRHELADFWAFCDPGRSLPPVEDTRRYLAREIRTYGLDVSAKYFWLLLDS